VYNFTAILRQVKNSKADQTASDIAPLVRKKSRSANKNTSTKLTDSTVSIDMSATADGAVAVKCEHGKWDFDGGWAAGLAVQRMYNAKVEAHLRA